MTQHGTTRHFTTLHGTSRHFTTLHGTTWQIHDTTWHYPVLYGTTCNQIMPIIYVTTVMSLQDTIIFPYAIKRCCYMFCFFAYGCACAQKLACMWERGGCPVLTCMFLLQKTTSFMFMRMRTNMNARGCLQRLKAHDENLYKFSSISILVGTSGSMSCWMCHSHSMPCDWDSLDKLTALQVDRNDMDEPCEYCAVRAKRTTIQFT